MKLAQFITAKSEIIISEWEEFARGCLPAATLVERRDHVALMLEAIALDLSKPQSKHEQTEKSKGNSDAPAKSGTAASAHGTDRAASGYTPGQMVAEFRALRASVMRLFAEAHCEGDRAMLDDVTRFNEAIDQALAESMSTYAQGVDRAKDLFLGVLGHDLRNPVGAIMMATTVMLAKEGPEWPHAKTASRILTSTTRMDEMIADLLDFTRTRLGGGIPIVRATMDLEEVCRQTVDEISAFRPNCEVRFDASGDLHGEWDSRRIAQMLSNLVGNACQHGAKNVPVEVTVGGAPDQVVLAVLNQGPVIPEGRRQEIFDPFRQLKAGTTSRADASSIGLGLYIAQAIVLAHQGRIDVESTEQGTIFTVRLPRKVAPKPHAKSSSPAA